jgi:hypothetical protein
MLAGPLSCVFNIENLFLDKSVGGWLSFVIDSLMLPLPEAQADLDPGPSCMLSIST